MGHLPGELSAKHRRFCQEYVIDFNGAGAAVRAGYAPRHARITASQLLADVSIQATIREAQRLVQDEAGVTEARITQELAGIGFAELAEEPIKLQHKLKALELLVRHLTLNELERRLAAVEERMQEGRDGYGRRA
jgi:phage terminase small subunit